MIVSEPSHLLLLASIGLAADWHVIDIQSFSVPAIYRMFYEQGFP
jgi:hypothetical protein